MVNIVFRILNLKYPLSLGFCLLITVFQYKTLNAQVINGNNWFFGNSDQALLFKKADNETQIEPIQATPFGQGGSLVISDEYDGNFLFYTDGQNIYDATHVVIPGGTGLTGDPSLNQAVAGCPVPGGSNIQWYIFTNSGATGVNEIQYTRVRSDLVGNASQPNQPDLGEQTVDKNVTTGLTNPAPGMLMVRSSTNPNLYWLLSQERTTGEFRTMEVSTTVIGNIQPFNSGSAPQIVAENFSANIIGADSVRIAVSPQNANANVQLWFLNTATGQLTFETEILNSGNADDASPAIYDTEWSRDGTKLYISRQGSSGISGNLYQFDFNDTLLNVNSILPAPIFRSYGLKMGPNDTLYHLYQPDAASAIQLGAITQPDQEFDSVLYDPLPLPTANFNGRQFAEQAEPNTVMFNLVDFTFTDPTCIENSAKFSPDVDPPPLFYFWDFGDQSTSFAHSPIHTYNTAGMYQVSLSVLLNGVVETTTRTVQVFDPGLMLDLGADTTICQGDSIVLTASDPAAIAYAWNTGETTPNIEVDSTGTYWVAVQTIAGCKLYDEVEVTVYGDTISISNQWYFGEMAGIDFNENPPVALLDSNQMNSPEAASTISDTNGDLLFYSNGVSVYNKEHDLMLNGAALGGDSTSAQGALIVQVPGEETIFYQFTTDPAWGDQTFDLRYSMIDIKEDTARGMVMFKNRPLYYKSTERLTASSTGNTVWVVSHEFGNNTFRSYPIDSTGIGRPTFSTVGTILSPATEGHSKNSMKLSPDVTKLAMTISGPQNFVEIYDFVDSVGEVMNPIKIDIEEPAPAEIYSVEFGGTDRLYVTTRGGGTSKLIQYDLDTLDADTIRMSKFVLAQEAQDFGTLQTGPDQRIFMAIDGSTDLGTINSPGADDANANFVLAGFNLGGRISRLGLPNFVQNSSSPPQPPAMAAPDVCFGDSTRFTGTGTSNIDEFFWTFGDGNTSTDQSPVHLYASPGTYNVSLTITNQCVVPGPIAFFSEPVDVTITPPRPTTQSTVLCQSSIILEALPADDPLYTYQWSTGDTTRQITISAVGNYTVAVVDIATGCISEVVPVLVGPAIDFDLGPDQTVCQGATVNPLATSINLVHQWSINGSVVAGNSSDFQPVNTNTAGVFLYEVAVTDNLNGCVVTDSVTITVNETPDIVIATTDTGGCGQSDGSIDLTINSSGNFDYTVTATNGTSIPAGTLAGPGTINIPNLASGSYSVTATNQVTNCPNTVSANLEDAADYDVTLAAIPACGSDGDLVVSVTGNFATYDWNLFDDSGALVRSGVGESLATLPIDDLDTGVYNILVTRQTPLPLCVQAAQVNLSELPPGTITINPSYNFCGGQGTITPTLPNGGTLTWTLPDNSLIVTNSLTVTQSGQYSVSSSGTGICPRTETTDVQINNDPVITIDIGGDICDGTRPLTATSDNVGGSNSFVWSTGANTASIDVTQTATYTVTSQNQNTGCQSNAAIDAEVEPLLELFISLEPDCDNNPNVFLMAESNITADVTFEWTSPAGDILPDTTAIITVNESGTYSARVIRIVSRCEASASFDVVIDPIEDDELILPVRTIICPDSPTTAVAMLDAGFFSSFEWRLLPDETVISTAQVFEASIPGRYEVTISNGLTCIRDFIDVIEDCTPRIFAPNAFTPNNDDINNNFFVFNNPFVTEFSIWIYNRWGEIVFQSNSLDFRWDGSFRGEPAPVGTYAWVARFRSSVEPELGEIEEHGAITLIR